MQNKNRNNIFWLSELFFLSIFLFSCADNRTKKVDDYILQLKKEVYIKYSKKILPMMKINPPVPQTYTASISLSPFGEKENPVNSKDNKITNPLQVYPITMLRLVGTSFEENQSYAYILAPDKKLYTIKNGAVIGDRFGKVIRIVPDHIEVKEREPSETSDTETQRIVTIGLTKE